MLVGLNLPNAVTPSYSISCCGDPPTIELFLLLLHNYNFAATMNCNVMFLMILGDLLRKGHFQRVLDSQLENHCHKGLKLLSD